MSGAESYLQATMEPNSDLGKAVIPDYPNAGYIVGFRCEYGTFNPEQAAEIQTLMEIVNKSYSQIKQWIELEAVTQRL